MKKYFFVSAFICSLIFYGGCATEQPTEGVNTPPTLVLNYKPKEKSEQTIVGKVIKIENEMLLVADTKKTGLYQIATRGFDGDIDQINAGDLIEIGFDGMILEIYPAIIANPDYVVLLEKGENLVGLTCDMLVELFETDPGLNSDISFIALDLTKDKNLTDGEKNALLYLLWNATQIETRLATYDDLLSDNLIVIEKDTKFVKMDNGILMTLESSKMEKETFTFTAQKWRSSLGAYGFIDCVAKKEDGKWSYIVGKEMIS